MPLIYNFFLILLFSLLASWLMKTTKDKNIYLLICFLVLLYVHSMVDVDTLPDLPAYQLAFEETMSLSWVNCLSWNSISFKIEPGYLLFFKAISKISHNFQSFLWANSIILITLYFWLIKNYSRYYVISVLLLLLSTYNQSLFVLRQHLAAVILLASFPLVRDKKHVGFWILIFISFFIHQSALAFIPVYYLYNFNRRNLKIAIAVIAVLFFFGFQRLLIFGSNITVSNEVYVYTEEGEGMNFRPAVIGVSWLIVYFVTVGKHVFDEGLNKFLFVLTSMGAILLIAGVGFNPAGRLSIYFTSCHFLLMPVIWHYLRRNRIFRFFLLSFYLAIGFYGSFIGSSWRYIEDLKLVSWFN